MLRLFIDLSLSGLMLKNSKIHLSVAFLHFAGKQVLQEKMNTFLYMKMQLICFYCIYRVQMSIGDKFQCGCSKYFRWVPANLALVKGETDWDRKRKYHTANCRQQERMLWRFQTSRSLLHISFNNTSALTWFKNAKANGKCQLM